MYVNIYLKKIKNKNAEDCYWPWNLCIQTVLLLGQSLCATIAVTIAHVTIIGLYLVIHI